MIFIAVKFEVRIEDADHWPEIVRTFTEATRAEPGCLWFEWSRSVDHPNEYMLIEAFADPGAGAAHVRSAHFKKAQFALPPHLLSTPWIVNAAVAQDNWSRLVEMAVGDAS